MCKKKMKLSEYLEKWEWVHSNVNQQEHFLMRNPFNPVTEHLPGF